MRRRSKEEGALFWTPDYLLGLMIWADPEVIANLSLNTQPVVADADMEAAGTASYTAIRSVLSKVAGSPGGTGAQVLRSTGDGTGVYQRARQVCTIGGNRYDLDIWGRTDGVAGNSLAIGDNSLGVGTVITAPSSLVWARVTGTFNAAGTTFCMASASNALGAWGEFDNIILRNRSVRSLAKVAGSVAGMFEQLTAASMPATSATLINSKATIQTEDNTVDGLPHNAAAATWNCLHDGTGATVFMVVYRPAAGAGTMLLCNHDNAVGNYGAGLQWVAASDNVRLTIANGTAAFANDVTAGGFTAGAAHILEFGISAAGGVDLQVDGAAAVVAAAGALAPNNATTALNWMRRASGNSFVGPYGAIIIVARHLSPTDPDRVSCRNYLSSYYGIPVP